MNSKNRPRLESEPPWLRKALIRVCIVVLAFSLTAIVVAPGKDLKLWENLNTVLSLVTLLVAAGIWVDQLRSEARDHWPKRLTVRFYFPNDGPHAGRMALECRKVYLAGEGDIRNWAQQIGSQMAGGTRLDFDPGIEQSAGRKDRLAGGSPCLHYHATFLLTELPNRGEKPEVDAVLERLERGMKRYWDYSAGTREEQWIEQ